MWESDDEPLIVLALGKFGSRQMHYASDLDLIFLYDDLPEGMAEVARVAAARGHDERVERILDLLSGVTSVDYETMTIVGVSGGTAMTPGKVDPEVQWRQVLSNIRKLVEEAGGTMKDVVLANVFVTDMRYYYEYQHVREEFFEPPYPVCTAVAVRALVHPDWILEIEAMAYIEDKA